jgi:hypothetical protein
MSKVTLIKLEALCKKNGITVMSYEDGATLLQTTFPRAWRKGRNMEH